MLGGSLSLLWGLVNALQLTTSFPFSNIRYPTNAGTWFGVLQELASFNIVSTESLEELIDNEVDHGDNEFIAEQYLTSTMIEAGYDNADSINGSMLPLSFISVSLFLTLVVLLIKLACRGASLSVMIYKRVKV